MRIIAGRWRGHTIAAPPGTKTRPTTDRVREAWMSALQLDIPGARVLDLFAGSGALGLEALSRGAERVTFVEKASGPLRALNANVHKLQAADAVEVVRGDALKYAGALGQDAFDIAFADPPYGTGAAEGLAEIFLERRFAQQLWIEHRAGDPLPAAPGAETRRYGDTALTFIPAPE
ncbi:MAG TPA: 16S rRNA (guanine(966)-N(2))-methyltransferase RsmD [Longimicrobiales bacterium]